MILEARVIKVQTVGSSNTQPGRSAEGTNEPPLPWCFFKLSMVYGKDFQGVWKRLPLYVESKEKLITIF